MFEKLADAIESVVDAMKELLASFVEAVVTTVTPTTHYYGGGDSPERSSQSSKVLFSSPSLGG